MKPHFGQSDAAMNKLAGCNKFPNAGKGLEQIAELEARAKELGFETVLDMLKSQYEEAAGMGLEPMFFERNPHLIRKMLPAANMTDDMTPIDEDFDPVKERDAAYDLGYRDAQRQHMTPPPLPEGYYGHHNGCDCAVCEDIHMSELAKQQADAAWNKLLDDNAELWRHVINYRDALERIVSVSNSGSNFPQDGRMYDIAKASLAAGHKPR